MKNEICLGLALAVALSLPAQAGAPKSGLVMVETESRIEVDSAGKLVSITTTPELPPAVKAEVEANLRKLQFGAPIKDGRAVAGVTYVRQDACAAPEGDAYRFAVKYRGNGPSLQKMFYPVYPREAEIAGVQSKWKVTYLSDASGKASVVDAVRESGGGGRHDKRFRGAIDAWMKSMQFQPEQVDGVAVDTRMEVTVEFHLGKGAPKGSDELAQAAGSDACQLAIAARDDKHRAVALNSPFRPLKAN